MRRSRIRRRVNVPWYAAPLAASALTLTALCAGESVHAADIWLSRFVHATDSPVGDVIGKLGYYIGATDVTIGLAVLLSIMFAAHGHRAEAMFVIGTAFARGLNPLLKALVDSPRPPPSVITVNEYASGLGFPSSHAMGVVLLFGALAHLAHRLIRPSRLRRFTLAAAGGAILITGFGRIYTGAHWSSDVLGGYLWGTIWLMVLITAYRVLGPTSRRVESEAGPGKSPITVPMSVRSSDRIGNVA
jgi:membrane-associated phospholipid phosphatase